MSRLNPPVGPGDHALGKANASVTLVEYGDYECPFCRRAHLSVKEVLRRMGQDVRYVFRHFPLAEMHPRAVEAAEAAEAAGQQGKFWHMHDMLFQNQNALEYDDLVGYAQALSLDTRRFASELASHVHQKKVRDDFLSGMRSGVHGTPAFFINGVPWHEDWAPDTLAAALRNANHMRGGVEARP